MPEVRLKIRGMHMNERLIHDVAWATAAALSDIVSPCLREEEKPDAFAEFYQAVKAGLEVYEIQVRRMEQRLRPGAN
jgi:hypothetical protein